MRSSAQWLVESVGLKARTFASHDEFMQQRDPSDAGCVLLATDQPDESALQAIAEIQQDGQPLPVIIVAANADIPSAVRAIKGGAFDFLEKPVNEPALLDSIQRALEHERETSAKHRVRAELDERIATLTPREMQVMGMVVSGMANKHIAAELGLSEKTIEVHRKHVMEKLAAGNVADLIRMVVHSSTPVEL